MKSALEYITVPEKTQNGRLVSAINCQVDNAFEQMKETKKKTVEKMKPENLEQKEQRKMNQKRKSKTMKEQRQQKMLFNQMFWLE